MCQQASLGETYRQSRYILISSSLFCADRNVQFSDTTTIVIRSFPLLMYLKRHFIEVD